MFVFKKLLHEFISAGDIEKKHKLEVSQLCDREINTVGNIQIGKKRGLSAASASTCADVSAHTNTHTHTHKRPESGTCRSSPGTPLSLFTLFIAACGRKTTDTRLGLTKYEKSVEDLSMYSANSHL